MKLFLAPLLCCFYISFSPAILLMLSPAGQGHFPPLPLTFFCLSVNPAF